MKKTVLFASPLELGLGATAWPMPTMVPLQVADTKPASIDELDQRVRILERQLEIQKDDASAKGATAVNASLDKDGFVVKSADGQFRFSAKTLVQADTRSYESAYIKIPQNNTFTIRKGQGSTWTARSSATPISASRRISAEARPSCRMPT